MIVRARSGRLHSVASMRGIDEYKRRSGAN